MQFSSSLPVPSAILSRRPRGFAAVFLAALLAPFLLAIPAVVAFETANSGRIYPGVAIARVDLGRARPAEALDRLARVQHVLATSHLTLRAGGRSWTVRGADLGAHYDLTSQVQAAYELGRGSSLLGRLRTQAALMIRPRDLLPLVRYNKTRIAAVVAGLASQIDRPAIDAALVLQHGSVTLLRAASPGRRLMQPVATARVVAALRRLETSAVPLPLAVLNPRVSTAAALRRAARMNSALTTGRRAQAALRARESVITRHKASMVRHMALRHAHLEMLASGHRPRLREAAGSAAALGRPLAEVRAGGRSYSVPPGLWATLRRLPAAALVPRPEINGAGVRRYVAWIATQVDTPARPARLILRHGHLGIVPSRPGTTLDTTAAERIVAAGAIAPAGTLVLPVRQTRPPVETASLAPAFAQGHWLLAHPPTLIAGTVHWQPRVGALAAALRISPPREDRPQTLTLDPAALRRLTAWLAGKVALAPRDASFAVDGHRAHVIPSADGQALDAVALAQSLIQASPGTTQVAVPIRRVAPHLSTARAQAMGIHMMIGMSYTNFYGSSGDRITNILTAMRVLDGSLIAPGAVFSFNKAVGDIDYSRGYVDELTILDGKDVPGVGGGVCQVAVTIFKAAIYTGLPIVERWPHANVVSYYQPIGMDATIYSSPGGPDVKFKNDTGHWLLLKFDYDLNTAYLEARFYSADIHQSTEIYGPYYSYLDNGDTTAIFFRKVYRNGKKIRDENFYSHYVPVIK